MSPGVQPRRVQLELEAAPDPIRGTLEHGDGTREHFHGWLELMAALERAAPDGASRRPDRSVSGAA
jgi:hypothetical protein